MMRLVAHRHLMHVVRYLLMALIFHLTVRVSELAEQNKDLVQALALLSQRLETGERARSAIEE